MRFSAALLYATATAVLVSTGMAFAIGQLSTAIAAVSLLAGILVGAFSLWSERRSPREPWKIDTLGGAVLLVCALFGARCFLWLVFEAGDRVWVLSPNNLGDMPLHLTYIRLLANGAPFWPENPIFAGAPLTYPLGMDLFNSLLLLVGVDIYRGLIVVGLVGTFCLAASLWRWGRGFALAGFLFAGGTLGFEIFTRREFVDYQSDLSFDSMLVVGWKSLPLAIFVTQRGFLYALPAGLLLLASWRARFIEPGRSAQRLPLWGEVLLYAAMPMFHLHTFLFLSVVAAWWFIAMSEARKHLGTVVASAFVPATILTWCVTGGFHGASMLGWQPGWMQRSIGYANPVSFWLVNFGVWPLLIGWLLVRLVRQRGPNTAALLAFPGITIFLLCCFVKFAQWEWDNTKLMIWGYLLLLPPLWSVVLSRLQPAFAGVACFLLFFSGAVSLLGGMAAERVGGANSDRSLGEPSIGYVIGVRSEIVGATEATRGIPMTDRFVAHPTYDHPLLESGRVLAMGYIGHVTSHGIEGAEKRYAVVQDILRGEDHWQEAAEALGTRWLYWGSHERRHYPDSKRPWFGTCRLHASGSWGELYDLREPALPPGQ